MKVYKFGGASINSLERFKDTAKIIAKEKGGLLVVISAMGKVTNALEAVANAFFNKETEKALVLFEEIKSQHKLLMRQLVTKNAAPAENQLRDIFTEVEWLLHDEPVRGYDYYYDQIVCCGELLSTTIMYFYLKELGADVAWVDVRDVLRTDNNFRDAAIDWLYTSSSATEITQPLLNQNKIVITQGFIGATSDNESTTLGREGSDYTAAIFANILDAESVSIWKDVEAVMSADPREFPEAKKISKLSYAEVIEMAYYGAQVIHPKTIKPLQNKNIPLLVKNFLDPSLPGTEIRSKAGEKLPPVIVVKKDQALLQFISKDFSFVEGAPIEKLHEIFNEVRLGPNVTQNTAISLLCSFDNKEEKLQNLALKASDTFEVMMEKGLTLLTIRHYDNETIEKMVNESDVVLKQKTPQTLQVLMRNG